MNARESSSLMSVATRFAVALDTEDYEALAELLSLDCEYAARRGTPIGPEVIIESYREASRWAKARIASVKYESSVRVSAAGSAIVTFIDHFEDSGIRHSYCCRQSLSIGGDGRISRIEHVEIPGRREAADSFLRQIGVMPASAPLDNLTRIWNPSMDPRKSPYHAHIYYVPATRAAAEAFWRRLGEMKESREIADLLYVGQLRDRKVGPHPIPQFEIHFTESALPIIVPLIVATGLTALVHPLTDDDLADHTRLARWIGQPLALDLTTLDPPGINQGIARFSKSDF